MLQPKLITNIIKQQFLLFNNNNIDNELYDIIIDYLSVQHIMVYGNIDTITFSLKKSWNLIKIFIDETSKETNEILLLNEPIIWKFNEQNLKTPFFVANDKNTNILFVKINENSNIYDWSSSNSFLTDEDIITGEKIQHLSDIVICANVHSLYQNPNNIKYSKQLILLQNNMFIPITPPNNNPVNTIFTFTHDISNVMQHFNFANKILISHNSDHPVNTVYSSCKYHFAQNCEILNESNGDNNNKTEHIIPLPIGIENTQWFDASIFHEIRKMNPIAKTKFIYFNFNINTHQSRKKCFEQLHNIFDWNEHKPKKEYFLELAKYKYAICPRGNGLDTHRIWECLYLNVIPIVIKNEHPNIQNLPIIILNDWSELTGEYLSNINDTCVFTNLKTSKISLEYYKNLIHSL
jgi:hypothetical protein